MNTQEVANKWLSMCQQGKYVECINELYDEQVVSKEMPGFPGEIVSGKAAVHQKSLDFLNSVQEFHSGQISDPVVAGNHFTAKMDLDITFKDRGRQRMEEVCVFEVKNGKITAEQFFYDMPDM